MNVESLFPYVKKPSRYVGNEFHVVKKDWGSARMRMALAFPDLYEIGMSHQGLQILYHLVNSRDEFLAERVYAPDLDLEKLLRQSNLPLFSLESRRPLAEFDVVGITLPYELCYTNILSILDCAGIPFRAADRDGSYPLIIGGGPGAFHPEPVADFFDAILLGDGEEAILEIAEIVMESNENGSPEKAALLNRLADVQGLYVPSFFSPEYDQTGEFKGVRPLVPGYERVRRRVLPRLPDVPFSPLVPLARIVHDRLGVEIARGCTRGCRFCQAGIIYRPVRERPPEQIFEIAQAGIAQGGFDEVALLSLSTGDYACLPELLSKLMDNFASKRVSVSMPSMRVGTLTPEIMAQIRRVRKTGFTLAPEAGSDRLRRIINKGITEEDLLDTSRAAFGLGWKLIKLYFMFGLPMETREDFEAIPELARKVLRTANRGGCNINVSAATFVPKPHTSFQWEPQLDIEQGFDRIGRLKESLRGRGFRLKWHDPRQSFLEGVMSRGDRRLSNVIEEAWRRGARLDAWAEFYDLNVWQHAAKKCGVDLSRYLRRRDFAEPLPWEHLDTGVDKEFVKQEYDKATDGVYTPDCRNHGCQKCGLCDFKSVQPVVHRCRGEKQHEEVVVRQPEREFERHPPVPACGGDENAPHFVYRIIYSRLDAARFLGHLELIQVLYRVFRRVDLPIHFSKGFNPSPKVIFSPALPVGTESLAEYLIVDLTKPIADMESLVREMNRNLPTGLEVKHVELGSKKQSEKIETCYLVSVPKDVPSTILDAFIGRSDYSLSVSRKGKERRMDVRPFVKELSLTEDGRIQLVMASVPGKLGVKPMELLAAVSGLTPEEVLAARILKVWSTETA